jgi:ABC-2 type transport system permease protein
LPAQTGRMASMESQSIPRPTLRTRADIAAWAAYARYRELASYPGWFLLDVFIPVIIAAVPILLGRAVGGADAATNFAQRSGTANYAAFLLIGANTFLMTLRAFWDIGLWLHKEQQTGTLEALYVTPADRRWLLVGLAAFNLARGLINFGLSFTLGCLMFAVNPLQGNWLVAIVFLCVGVTPLYALSLIYGAIVLRLKETDALIQIAQSVLTLAMGIYYPITVLPALARAAALFVPPMWMTNGMRAALLGTGYILGAWPRDVAVLAAMCLVGPPLAFAIFRRTERLLQRGAGVGEF